MAADYALPIDLGRRSMTTLTAATVRTSAARISDLAVVTAFSLIGLVVTLIAARYGIDVAGGASG
jgi:hypothetical protein